MVVLVLLGTVALRVALVLGVVWLLFPGRTTCPRCGDATLSLVTPRALRALRIEKRWCVGCGWGGLSKRVPPPQAAPEPPAPAGDPEWASGDWKARWDDDDQWSRPEGDRWR